jgi:hypothetical protein
MIPHRMRGLGGFGLAILLAVLNVPTVARAAGDPNVTHVDGYYTASRNGCSTLREHDGKVDSLVGELRGLRTGDHVRLEGRFVNGSPCGGTAVEVTLVQALWADDNHKTTYYDHLVNRTSFQDWSASNRGGRRH